MYAFTVPRIYGIRTRVYAIFYIILSKYNRIVFSCHVRILLLLNANNQVVILITNLAVAYITQPAFSSKRVSYFQDSCWDSLWQFIGLFSFSILTLRWLLININLCEKELQNKQTAQTNRLYRKLQRRSKYICLKKYYLCYATSKKVS